MSKSDELKIEPLPIEELPADGEILEMFSNGFIMFRKMTREELEKEFPLPAVDQPKE